MAQNKNALIRYRTIDKCLQNRSKRWTLKDLINACSDALYEYEGKQTDISKRTTQLDLQIMRSDKLGYKAPIEVYDRKYYRYADEDYSITNVPLTQIDMDVLTESVEMLKQFKDFSLFQEMNGVIQKLEDKVYREKDHQSPIIHIDKNENLKGLHFLDALYQAILKEFVLDITYQSFKSRQQSHHVLHPLILKEFNNRWFLIGRNHKNNQILTLALDRIEKAEPNLKINYDRQGFDADEYYKNTFGVTVMSDSDLIDLELKIDRYNAPYVITKPFHPSQQVSERCEDGSVIFTLKLHHNFELERLILGFGDAIQVLKPRRFRQRIKKKFKNALEYYL
ncbi:helix-turn-helix transcriptional regulator [Portibacter lacus]|uniref:WYL domain-containing protein n=1 Tax=Portibacter lacus TaxID=1099794 RepID=A0AA37SQX5_9BACT|nr:WYL domain-containing protein [Portibacter lacus]